MHPDRMRDLGLTDGDLAEIESIFGRIVLVVHGDETMRLDSIATSHMFGGLPT